MNTRFNILGIISLTIALALTYSDRAVASHTLVGNSTGNFLLQENAGIDAATTPVTPSAGSPFRNVPSLSGRYFTGNMTFLPYIGAGFGAGYNSELDRTFAPNLQPQQNLNVGGLQGQSMVPNEFQMGIRIPF
ncbi:MAG: hypothetical protein JJE16_13705 [Nitrospiraceae bacterium]|nr:hypothetical protein [Nitrospiraceae bacterium]